MKNILFILFFMVVSISIAQVQPRVLLNGKIIATQNTENVTIYNTTTSKGSISNIEGEFNIYAKAKDTLVFSSIALQTKKIIIKDSDLDLVIFNIKLEEKLNELEEVVVSNNSLTGVLKVDADNIKTVKINTNVDLNAVAKMEFEKDLRSSPDIKGMYNYAPDPYGMDFVKIGKLIGKALNIETKKNKEPITYSKEPIYNFKDLVLNSFEMNFFEKDLKLKPEELGEFLDFCVLDEKLMANFYNQSKFEKIETLVLKTKENAQKNP